MDQARLTYSPPINHYFCNDNSAQWQFPLQGSGIGGNSDIKINSHSVVDEYQFPGCIKPVVIYCLSLNLPLLKPINKYNLWIICKYKTIDINDKQ